MRRDYDPTRERPPWAPIIAIIFGLTFTAVAIAVTILAMSGMPLR